MNATMSRLEARGFTSADAEIIREKARKNHVVRLGCTIDDLLPFAKGRFQEAALYGHFSWSCACLKGKARSFLRRYVLSLAHLVDRIERSTHIAVHRVLVDGCVVVIFDGRC